MVFFPTIELEHIFLRGLFLHCHRIKAYILADKMLELIGRDLSQTFESGDLPDSSRQSAMAAKRSSSEITNTTSSAGYVLGIIGFARYKHDYA